MTKPVLFFIMTFALVSTFVSAQETLFSVMKKRSRVADDYFKEGNFKAALEIYTKLHEKDSASHQWTLKMGRCSYFLKDFSKAISAYSQLKRSDLPVDDVYYLAESFAALDQYKQAISCYQLCMAKSPGNQLVSQKIWRLNNIKYLFEDSLHFAVRALPLNTTSGELAIAPFRQGVVFISNRKQVQVIEKMDASKRQPFYHAYYASAYIDSSGNTLPRYRKPAPFGKSLFTGLNAGPMAFYAHSTKMVYVSSNENTGSYGEHSLQLFFAELVDKQWKRTSAFAHNNDGYSVTDPSISDDGSVLYFSSDMPGGFGGKDIYRSFNLNGGWSKPENLGEVINTEYDETAPFLHLKKVLYFSSSGHAGLGGTDIFKTTITNGNPGEVENMGYPLNSTSDEFGIIIDSLSTHGYFSSNRKNGGYDDDLYEFDMDLQTYPLELMGTLRLKEFAWNDSSELKPFGNARYYLIDNLREVIVHEGTSDERGNFKWTIPYFSKYRVRVIGPDNDEHVVSLEIPKHRKDQSNHEIVVVKDLFK